MKSEEKEISKELNAKMCIWAKGLKKRWSNPKKMLIKQAIEHNAGSMNTTRKLQDQAAHQQH